MRTNIGLKLVITFVLVLIGCIASASVELQIHRANPKLSVDRVVELAGAIKLSCRTYKVPCDVFTAILIQESMLRIDAVNHTTLDYSIGQLNIKTIKAYKFDKKRLLTDLQYSTDAAAKVLSWFYIKHGHNSIWYCKYNVGTKSLVGNRLQKCLMYVSRVSKYMPNHNLAKVE